MKKLRKLFKTYLRKSLRRFKKTKLCFKRRHQEAMSMALILLICFLAIGATNVRAGSLTPSGAPAASGYTLGDIYVRLSTNVTATAGNHDLATTTSPAGSFYTLTQIYEAIPTINAAMVKLGTSYLGVAGALTPDGGTATAVDLFSGKTANLTADWDLDTGTLTIACATTTFNGIANKVPDAYDGIGNGANRWCITDSGDAVAGDILSGKIAWIDGAAVTGSITVKTGDTAVASSSAQGTSLVFTIPQGYYDGTDSVTVATTSSVFIAGNIASGVNLFGLAGTLLGYAYGGNSIDQVLTTATGTPGTYNPSNLIASNVKSGVTFGTSTIGSLLPSGGTASPSDVTSGKTFFGTSQTDWNLQTGTASVIDYSLWNLQTIDDWVCSGATSCTGKTEYTAEEGTWSNVSGSPFNAGFATSTTPLNYFPVGANVYLASGRVKQDNRTGLWWSDAASTGAVTAAATSTTNNFTLTGAAGVGDGTRPWDTATTTATNGNAINFCNALNAISFAGHTDWYLPTQKELMQAYINGSANNLPNAGFNFWSSTEVYNNTANAWNVGLYYGSTNGNTKTSSYYLRCVRRP